MGDRHIQPCADRAHLFGRGHDGAGLAQNRPHPIATGGMPQRAMLQLAVGPDDGPLAIALNLRRIAAQQGQQPFGHL